MVERGGWKMKGGRERWIGKGGREGLEIGSGVSRTMTTTTITTTTTTRWVGKRGRGRGREEGGEAKKGKGLKRCGDQGIVYGYEIRDMT